MPWRVFRFISRILLKESLHTSRKVSALDFLRKLTSTPARRIAIVTTLMALAWGTMVTCQGVRGPIYSADWALMGEVGRRVALGDTLYVDAMDQKGPLCYAVYALEWLICRKPGPAFVFSNVVLICLLTTASGIAARIVEDVRRPWDHLPVQALLAAVILVPHVGCIEEWLVPFGLLAALWVRRLTDGRHVSDWCWVVVGLSAGFALWSKFTCCAQFVFVLAYGLSRENTKGLGRAVVIALISCLVATAAVLAWMWFGGSFEGMLRHHLFAATDGYAGRMSMWKYLEGSNPSSTHVTSFFVGAPVAIWSLIMIARGAHRKLPVIVFGLVLMVCCFATFVGYYRFQLATLVVLGGIEISNKPWSLKPLRWLNWVEEHVRGRGVILGVLSLVAIGCATYFCCDGTPATVAKSERIRNALHEAVGKDDSVLVWQFGNTWVYAELGLDFPYAIPARYNASQDLWDSTAGADLAAGRWRYVICSVNESTAKLGDNAKINGGDYKIIGLEGGMAVCEAGGGEDAISDIPYRLP